MNVTLRVGFEVAENPQIAQCCEAWKVIRGDKSKQSRPMGGFGGVLMNTRY
jgi:hypothetical protein